MMKKIFTLIAAAFIAVSVNAAKTTIWTSDNAEGTLIEWDKPNVTVNDVTLAAGDVLTVTVSKVDKSIYAYPQATLCTSVGETWEWTDLQQLLMPAAGEYTYDITADMVEKIAAHNQIFFKGTAAYISKIELTPSADIDHNLLWEGEYTCNWDKVAAVPAAKLADIALGDQIAITISGTTSGHQGLVYYDWGKMLPSTNKGVFVSGETTWTFGVTSSNIDILKANGFFVSGSGVTYTSIRRVEATDAHANAIWFGDIALSSARNGVEFYGPASTGDATALEITIDGTPSWIKIANSSWAAVEVEPTISGNTYTYELTDALKGVISNYIIQGDGFSLKEIKLTSGTTGINTVKAVKEDGVRYNLAGQKVSDSYKGVVIVNGKKVVVK